MSSSTGPLDTDLFIRNGGGDSFRAVQLTDTVESLTRICFPHLLDVILHETFSHVLEHIQRNVSEKTLYSKDGSDLESVAKEQEVEVVGQKEGKLLRNGFESHDEQRILMHSKNPDIVPTFQTATSTGSISPDAQSEDKQAELEYQQLPKRRKLCSKTGTTKKDGTTGVEAMNEKSTVLHDNSSELDYTVRDAAHSQETYGPNGNVKLEDKQDTFEKQLSSKTKASLSQAAVNEIDNDEEATKNDRFELKSESHLSPSRRLSNSASSWRPKEAVLEPGVCSSTAAQQKSFHDSIEVNMSGDLCAPLIPNNHLSQISNCHDIPHSSHVPYAIRRCSQWMSTKPDKEIALENICGDKKETLAGSSSPHIPPPQLVQRWKYDTGKCVDASPLVALTSW